MFIRDIEGKLISVGDTLIYATDGHGSTPNLATVRVDMIKFHYGEPKVRAHVMRHSNGVPPGSTVWLTRFDRMYRV